MTLIPGPAKHRTTSRSKLHAKLAVLEARIAVATRTLHALTKRREALEAKLKDAAG